jgi:hypothetical protein
LTQKVTKKSRLHFILATYGVIFLFEKLLKIGRSHRLRVELPNFLDVIFQIKKPYKMHVPILRGGRTINKFLFFSSKEKTKSSISQSGDQNLSILCDFGRKKIWILLRAPAFVYI